MQTKVWHPDDLSWDNPDAGTRDLQVLAPNVHPPRTPRERAIAFALLTLRTRASRAALFKIRDGIAEGVAGSGNGFRRRVRTLRVSLSAASPFQLSVATGLPYLGMWEDAGEPILLCPVVVEHRIAGLLYASGLDASADAPWAHAIAGVLGAALGSSAWRRAHPERRSSDAWVAMPIE